MSAVVADWIERAGGGVGKDGFWHLPLDLPDSYAARELKRIASNLGLLAKEGTS